MVVIFFLLFLCTPTELDEDWYHSDDPINAGISFYVKVLYMLNHLARGVSVSVCTQYLGSAPVTKTHGPGSTDDAVKAIVHHVSVHCIDINLIINFLEVCFEPPIY